MAKTAYSQWDTTATNNTDIGGITLVGSSMLVSQVDNALREIMAQLATAGFSTTAIATAAQIWANTADKTIDTDGAWSSALPVDLGNLTGNVTLDFATFINAKAAFTGNVTFNTASNNVKTGQAGVIEITHSGAARTLGLNATYFRSANGAGIQLSTAGAGTKDLLGYYVAFSGLVVIVPMALAIA